MLFDVGAPTEPETLIDRLLREQRDLTPVERFSRRHDAMPASTPGQQHRELIPGRSPAVGEQYAFAVDLDVCTGCKACVSACHSLNGLDEDETWRTTGLLHGSASGAAWQQTITTACHHCVEPGCLEGCPVQAYEKLPGNGVVRHLDDQCIGCQYCIMKCPYDVPKYSERLGIVRKCDLCIDRLEAGEAPACVQACPHEAIRIEIAALSSVEAWTRPGTRLVPGAFDSNYTKPTTRYHSKREIPADARPADADQLRLEPAHWPLVAMLILSQLAAGLVVCGAVPGILADGGRGLPWLAAAAWAALHAGLAASVFHLGRPLGAWRFFLGLRTSWMSREILAFGVFSGLSTALLAAAWLPFVRALAPALAGITALVGLAAVFTSAMIYIDTRRPFWSARHTLPRFFGATLLLGTSGSAALLAFAVPGSSAVIAFALAAMVIRMALFVWETLRDALISRDPRHECHRSMLAIRTMMSWIPMTRTALFFLSTAAAVAALRPAADAPWFALASFVSTALSLLLERLEFFRAVTAPRMPGGLMT